MASKLLAETISAMDGIFYRVWPKYDKQAVRYSGWVIRDKSQRVLLTNSTSQGRGFGALQTEKLAIEISFPSHHGNRTLVFEKTCEKSI
jgi:hypothetical protein